MKIAIGGIREKVEGDRMDMPKSLVGEYFETPDSPPMSKEQEKQLTNRMKKIRKRAFDPKTGELYKDREHAKYVADYENARHDLILKFMHIPTKMAHQFLPQCQKGMLYDDLFQSGTRAMIETIDKWPPFLGKKDKGTRMYVMLTTAVRRAMERFLDNNNRTVRIPTHRIEKLTVRLNADYLKYGRVKSGKKPCGDCSTCKNIYSKSCNRNKVNTFDKKVVSFLEKIGMTIDEADGKSLKDISIDNGVCGEVAELLGLSVDDLLRITNSTSSLDVSIGDDGDGGSIADTLIAIQEDNNHHVRENIEEAISHMPQRNAEILRDRFLHNMSIKDMKDKYGFSGTRAMQMVNKSVHKLINNEVSMNILIHKQ